VSDHKYHNYKSTTFIHQMDQIIDLGPKKFNVKTIKKKFIITIIALFYF